MRLIALTALMSVAFIAPSLGQTMASARPGLMIQTADLTVRDGSDAGPAQSALPGQDEAGSVADLPRVATHAPTRLGLPVPAVDTAASDSQ